ncbi:MAG: biotin--[acetyl-CoA-carboxylase] ligase [Candidatus Omnitrophica bacterium]|nr:biotin--[acetyl-CoA-carboxylase] ligase [Candidatus Omnitrophota bacterium]
MKHSKEICGIPVYIFGSVSSTMEEAEKLLAKGKNGIICAEEQFEGRGRYGRKWFSPPGGLYFSWILEEGRFSLFLSEILSLSIVESLQTYGISCRIKLPNDIITSGRKISGILILKKQGVYIAGVGINVNNAAGDGRERVSMKEIAGRPVEKHEVLESFIRAFLAYKKAFSENPEAYLQKWSNYLIK